MPFREGKMRRRLKALLAMIMCILVCSMFCYEIKMCADNIGVEASSSYISPFILPVTLVPPATSPQAEANPPVITPLPTAPEPSIAPTTPVPSENVPTATPYVSATPTPQTTVTPATPKPAVVDGQSPEASTAQEKGEDTPYKIIYYRYSDGTNNRLRYEVNLTQAQADEGYEIMDFEAINKEDGLYFWTNDLGETFDSLLPGPGYGFSGWDENPTSVGVTLPDFAYKVGSVIGAEAFGDDKTIVLYPTFATVMSIDASSVTRASLHLMIPQLPTKIDRNTPYSHLSAGEFYNKVGYATFSNIAFLDAYNGQFLGYDYDSDTGIWPYKLNDASGRGAVQFDGWADTSPGKTVEDYIVTGRNADGESENAADAYSAGTQAMKELLLKMEADGYLEDYFYHDDVMKDLEDNGVIDWFSVQWYKLIYAQPTPTTNEGTGLFSEQFHIDGMLIYDRPRYSIEFKEPILDGSQYDGTTLKKQTLYDGETMPLPPESWHIEDATGEGYNFIGWYVLEEGGATGMSYEAYVSENPNVNEYITFVAVVEEIPPIELTDEKVKVYDGETLTYTYEELWNNSIKEIEADRYSSFEQFLSEHSFSVRDVSGGLGNPSTTGYYSGPNVGKTTFTCIVQNRDSGLPVYKVRVSLTITQATLEIYPKQNYTKVFGEDDPLFDYTIDGLMNGDDEAELFTGIEVVRTQEGEAFGEYTIEVKFTPNEAADSKYDNYIVTPKPGLLVIVKSGQLAAAAPPVAVTYDGEEHGIDVEVIGILDGEPWQVLYSEVDFPGTYLHEESPTATDVEDSRTIYFMVTAKNYEPYYGSATITINPVKITYSANSAQKTYGMSDPNSYSADITSGKLVSGESLDYEVEKKTTSENAGVYADAITVDVEDDPNYAITEQSADFIILRAPASVNANSYTKQENEADPEFTAHVLGAMNGDEIQYTIQREAGEALGEYALTPIVGENSNYSVTTVEGVLTIQEKANDEPISSPTPQSTSEPDGGKEDSTVPQAKVDEDGNLVITSSKSEPPNKVEVNDDELGKDDYSIDGTGVLKIEKSYMKNLPDGEHVIKLFYGSDEFATTMIVDGGIPLSAGQFALVGEWGLFNLLSTLFCIIIAIAFFARRSKEKEGIEAPQSAQQSLNNKTKLISSLVSILSVIMLLFTQDFTLVMSFFDRYSWLFGAIALLQVVLALQNKMRRTSEQT